MIIPLLCKKPIHFSSMWSKLRIFKLKWSRNKHWKQETLPCLQYGQWVLPRYVIRIEETPLCIQTSICKTEVNLILFANNALALSVMVIQYCVPFSFDKKGFWNKIPVDITHDISYKIKRGFRSLQKSIQKRSFKVSLKNVFISDYIYIENGEIMSRGSWILSCICPLIPSKHKKLLELVVLDTTESP